MKHIIYLDNSSTTKPSKKACEYINKALTDNWGNPSSLHTMGIDAEITVDSARECIARKIGARADEIIFTGSGTEANNTAVLSALARKNRGNRVITSSIEHPSVLETVKRLENEGFEVIRLGCDSSGKIKTGNTQFTGTTATIYANWTPNIYKVTLDNQGATSAGTAAYWYKYNTYI